MPRRTATRLPLTLTVASMTLELAGTRSRIENLRRLTHFFADGNVTSFEKTGSAALAGRRRAASAASRAAPAGVTGGSRRRAAAAALVGSEARDLRIVRVDHHRVLVAAEAGDIRAGRRQREVRGGVDLAGGEEADAGLGGRRRERRVQCAAVIEPRQQHPVRQRIARPSADRRHEQLAVHALHRGVLAPRGDCREQPHACRRRPVAESGIRRPAAGPARHRERPAAVARELPDDDRAALGIHRQPVVGDEIERLLSEVAARLAVVSNPGSGIPAAVRRATTHSA